MVPQYLLVCRCSVSTWSGWRAMFPYGATNDIISQCQHPPIADVICSHRMSRVLFMSVIIKCSNELGHSSNNWCFCHLSRYLCMSTKLDHISIHMRHTIITSFLFVDRIRYAVALILYFCWQLSYHCVVYQMKFYGVKISWIIYKFTQIKLHNCSSVKSFIQLEMRNERLKHR